MLAYNGLFSLATLQQLILFPEICSHTCSALYTPIYASALVGLVQFVKANGEALCIQYQP